MKNIFVLSNSFSTRTILYQIDYLLNFKIGKIYILQENHDYMEVHNISNKVELVSSEDIDKYIYISDVVLILQDKFMSPKTIDRIKLSVTEKNKLIIVANPWFVNNPAENKLNEGIRYDSNPIILQIVFGEYTQHYCTEILLNKILSNEEVPFIQEFSIETLSLIEQLSQYGIINKKIIQSKLCNRNNYSVIVKSLYVNQFRVLSKDKKFIEMMELLSPSYIIMNISSNCIINDSIKDMFVHKYNKPISLIVKSPYVETDLTHSKCGTYCAAFDMDIDKTYSPTSSYLEKQLQVDLFAKIALPKDIVII